MLKWIKVSDYYQKLKQELVTYYDVPEYNFAILKWSDDKRYSLWYNTDTSKEKIFYLFYCKFLGYFESINKAKEYAFLWYVNNK